jgi:hypothetical protein
MFEVWFSKCRTMAIALFHKLIGEFRMGTAGDQVELSHLRTILGDNFAPVRRILVRGCLFFIMRWIIYS